MVLDLGFGNLDFGGFVFSFGFLVFVFVTFLFRAWGIVLVDLRPASLRAAVALRLP